MGEQAILLTGSGVSLENGNVAKVLCFFGVTWRTLTTAEFLSQDGIAHESALKSRLFCSADFFLDLLEVLEHSSEVIIIRLVRGHSDSTTSAYPSIRHLKR